MTEEPLRKGDKVVFDHHKGEVDVERAATVVLSTWLKRAMIKIAVFLFFVILIWTQAGTAEAAAFMMGHALANLLR
jgi:hypothetical protein